MRGSSVDCVTNRRIQEECVKMETLIEDTHYEEEMKVSCSVRGIICEPHREMKETLVPYRKIKEEVLDEEMMEDYVPEKELKAECSTEDIIEDSSLGEELDKWLIPNRGIKEDLVTARGAKKRVLHLSVDSLEDNKNSEEIQIAKKSVLFGQPANAAAAMVDIKEENRVSSSTGMGGGYIEPTHKYKCLYPRCLASFPQLVLLAKHRETHLPPHQCDYPGCDVTCPTINALICHRQTHPDSTTPHRCNYLKCSIKNNKGLLTRSTKVDTKVILKDDGRFVGRVKSVAESPDAQQELLMLAKIDIKEEPIDYAELKKDVLDTRPFEPLGDIKVEKLNEPECEETKFPVDGDSCRVDTQESDELIIEIVSYAEEYNIAACTNEAAFISDVKRPSPLNQRQNGPTGAKPYPCIDPGCSSAFSTSSSLVKHERTHTGEKPFKCDNCSMAFALWENLQLHRKAHTGGRLYKCESCDMSFVELSGLKYHKRYTCDKPFPQVSAPKSNHNTDENLTYLTLPSGATALEEPWPVEQQDASPTCPRLFPSSFGGHQDESLPLFNNAAGNAAETSNFPMQNTCQSEDKPFLCNYKGCDSAFSKLCYLFRHKKMHTVKKPFKCDFAGCDAAFSKASSFFRHNKKHTLEKDNCDTNFAKNHKRKKCDAALITFSEPIQNDANCNVANSTRSKNTDDIYIEDKPFLCNYEGCNSAFSMLCELNKHQKTIHPGCGSVFPKSSSFGFVKSSSSEFVKSSSSGVARSSSTVILEKVLTGDNLSYLKIPDYVYKEDKPFLCNNEGCGLGFSKLSELNRHKINNTGCGSVFARSSSLVIHEKVLSGRKPYKYNKISFTEKKKPGNKRAR